MIESDLPYFDIGEVGLRLRAGDISSVEITRALLDRIEALDVSLRSYVHVARDSALAQAATADRESAQGRWRSPLHGVPVALKDIFWTKDMPTTAGMPIRRNFQATEDASVVRRLTEAGAVLLGKLQLTEGAGGEHHPSIDPPVNPWNAQSWPGASSSGSGVAVAAGLCFAAMGTDTGGSIRFPSAANGVTGLKPSWGRVSRHGVFALSEALDCMGPLTRSVADAALMLSAIAGADPLDATAHRGVVPDYVAALGGGAAGLRIGVDPVMLGETDAVTGQAIGEALEAFVALGAKIIEKRLEGLDDATQAWWALCSAGAADAHKDLFPAHADAYGPSLRRAVEHGMSLSAADLIPVLAAREAFRAHVAVFFEGLDVFVMPVQPFAAPSLQHMKEFSGTPNSRERLLRFLAPFALTGQPALVVPGGATPEGLPIGLQIIALSMQEPLLLRAGHAYQQATHWHRRRPAGLTA